MASARYEAREEVREEGFSTAQETYIIKSFDKQILLGDISEIVELSIEKIKEILIKNGRDIS
jgi:predicted HTH domain antitoxin